MTRAIVGLESVLQHSVVYCNREGWQQGAVYCNTLHCIVAGRAAGGKVVSQYNLEYCGRRQGCLCRKAGSCVTTWRWVEALGARGAQAGAGAHRRQGRARQADAVQARIRGARLAGGTGTRQAGVQGAGARARQAGVRAAGERQQVRAHAESAGQG